MDNNSNTEPSLDKVSRSWRKDKVLDNHRSGILRIEHDAIEKISQPFTSLLEEFGSKLVNGAFGRKRGERGLCRLRKGLDQPISQFVELRVALAYGHGPAIQRLDSAVPYHVRSKARGGAVDNDIVVDGDGLCPQSGSSRRVCQSVVFEENSRSTV